MSQAKPRRLRGALLLLVAGIALLFGGVGISEVFLAGQSNLHQGTIVDSGQQELRIRVSSGGYQTSETAIVKLRLDDGTTHTVESGPLATLFNRARHALKVQVQLDSYGVPKRVRYAGRWYGAGPPIWFWLAFGLVLLAVGILVGRSAIVSLRRPVPVTAPTGESVA